MMPAALHIEIAATQTTDCRGLDKAVYVVVRRTYLDAEQEEGEVEVDARKDVFVRDRHQNGRTAVGQDGRDWVLRYRGRAAPVCRGCARQRGGRTELLARRHVDSVVVAFLVVRHCEGA